jgi:general stress protein YciG
MNNMQNDYGPDAEYRYSPAPKDVEEQASANNAEQKSVSQTKKSRGFSAMNTEKQRRIASLGGKAAHQMGTAHEFNSEEARAAGRKGGEIVSKNTQHMSEIGRKGGKARGHNHAAENTDTGSNS